LQAMLKPDYAYVLCSIITVEKSAEDNIALLVLALSLFIVED